MENPNNYLDVIEEKIRREVKSQKKKMRVSGKSVLGLQKLILEKSKKLTNGKINKS